MPGDVTLEEHSKRFVPYELACLGQSEIWLQILDALVVYVARIDRSGCWSWCGGNLVDALEDKAVDVIAELWC